MSTTQAIILMLTDLKRWTWRAGLALALIVVAYAVPRVASVSAGLTDLLDQGNIIGLALLAAEIARARMETPPPPAKVPDQRGRAAVHVLILALAAFVGTALVVGLATLVSGCALLERREIHTDTAPEVTYRMEDGRCVLRGFTDGHETYTAIGPVGEPCPAVTVRP